MNKIIIDENYIKSLPLTTNRIEVAWNENVFFSKYAIVSAEFKLQMQRNSY